MPESLPSTTPYLQEGGAWTSAEIAQQPQVWHETAAIVAAMRPAIDAFLRPVLAQPDLRIILTGAGSSAYIGLCLLPDLLASLGHRVEAIATTDIVAAPHRYLQNPVPTLLVSFARSGGSPESLAAVELTDQFVKTCHHLVITCNAHGELRRRLEGQARSLVIVLPEASHDRGFAMTSSFSCMLYAAQLTLAPQLLNDQTVTRMGKAARQVLEQEHLLIQALATRRYQRAVYLGSSGLGGLAQEAALKLLELTDGAVAALSNTSLGFRHGPKTFVNSETLIVLFTSNDPLTRRYDLDIARELAADGIAGRLIVLTTRADDCADLDPVVLSDLKGAPDAELAFAYVIWAQLFAFHSSLVLGCKPDSPSASGTVNRVVRGVTIHPAVG